MPTWIDEISESDSRTSYEIDGMDLRVRSQACESVIIADSPTYGRMLFLDGELQSAAADEHLYHEALVHPVLAGLSSASYHHDTGLRVLVVGGGEGATVREVLKWTPDRVDWIDIDGELVHLCEDFLQWAPGVRTHQAVRYQAADIRDALPSLGLYDAIILDLPDPDGNTGYLYSESFWSAMRDHLAPGGRLVTHCGPVRPFGIIGEGFRRVFQTQALRFHPSGFYSQSIPSFQGEWGFWIYGGDDRNPFEFMQSPYNLPSSNRAVDREQIRRWSEPTMAWRRAINSAVNNYRLH
jgi:spermidine synthase